MTTLSTHFTLSPHYHPEPLQGTKSLSSALFMNLFQAILPGFPFPRFRFHQEWWKWRLKDESWMSSTFLRQLMSKKLECFQNIFNFPCFVKHFNFLILLQKTNCCKWTWNSATDVTVVVVKAAQTGSGRRDSRRSYWSSWYAKPESTKYDRDGLRFCRAWNLKYLLSHRILYCFILCFWAFVSPP